MQTEKELRAELVSIMGGRAAEDIVFDTVTTGAANDIEKATKIARAMVTRFGMTKRFGLMGLETVQDEYLDRHTVGNYGEDTAAAIDEEVMAILKASYKEAKRLLKENREILDKIAEYLIDKETISGHEFMVIYCREKGIPLPEKEKGSEKPAVIDTALTSEEIVRNEKGKEVIDSSRGRSNVTILSAPPADDEDDEKPVIPAPNPYVSPVAEPLQAEAQEPSSDEEEKNSETAPAAAETSEAETKENAARIDLYAEFRNAEPKCLARSELVSLPKGCPELSLSALSAMENDVPEIIRLSGFSDLIRTHYLNHRQSFS